jgi:micrococcal nuclease
MDEPISKNPKKSKSENGILTGIAILLCILLVVILVAGIYASKNIRSAKIRPASNKVELSKSVAQSDVVQSNALQSDIVRVLKVVDGDTIVVESVSRDSLQKDFQQKTTIRLIGINTPETVDPRRKVECFGKEASTKAKEMLLDKTVRLEYDDTQDAVDKYGRRLAYVFIQNESFATKQVSNSDIETLFNAYMIEQGYAYEYTYSKPYKYQKEFKDAQKRAETEGRGLWSPASCDGKKSI